MSENNIKVTLEKEPKEEEKAKENAVIGFFKKHKVGFFAGAAAVGGAALMAIVSAVFGKDVAAAAEEDAALAELSNFQDGIPGTFDGSGIE